MESTIRAAIATLATREQWPVDELPTEIRNLLPKLGELEFVEAGRVRHSDWKEPGKLPSPRYGPNAPWAAVRLADKLAFGDLEICEWFVRLTTRGRRSWAQQNRRRRIEWLSQALLSLQEHPGWSDAEIAQHAGVHPGTLSRNRTYQNARNATRRNRAPTGINLNQPASRQSSEEESRDAQLDRDIAERNAAQRSPTAKKRKQP